MRFTRVGSGLTRKHSTRLKKIASNKHSSLFQKFINYGGKKFYNIAPCGLPFRKFYDCN